MHVAGAAANTGMEANLSQHLGDLRMSYGEAPPHYESTWQWACISMIPKLTPTYRISKAGPPSDVLVLRLLTDLVFT
jgi:hypothetical protein